MVEEKWKEIPDSDNAMVSSLGRISRRGKILKLRYDSEGYARVTVGGKRKTERVHRLVAEAFCVRVDGKNIVNHKNAKRDDNRAVNLEYCTNRENLLLGKKKNHGNGKTPVIVRDKEGNEKVFESQADAARWIGCDDSEVNKTLTGKRMTCHGYKIAYLNREDAERSIDAEIGQMRLDL